MFISHKTGGEWDLNIQKALASYPGPVNRTGSSHLGQTLIGLDLERLEFIFGNVSTAVWSPVCPQTYVNMCLCVISCRTLWQENNNPRTFGFSFDIFAVKGLYQKLPFLLLCFRPKMKKRQKMKWFRYFDSWSKLGWLNVHKRIVIKKLNI